MRAEECRRADRLFDDSYAQAFLDAAPGAFAKEERALSGGGLASLGEAFYSRGVIRTRFFDDYLLAACAAGCTQVVLLAAGLDTRGFRLPWPDGVHLFEIDLLEVLSFKERVLAGQGAVPCCERAVVPADLRENWLVELRKAGFRPSEPTAWLACNGWRTQTYDLTTVAVSYDRSVRGSVDYGFLTAVWESQRAATV